MKSAGFGHLAQVHQQIHGTLQLTDAAVDDVDAAMRYENDRAA